MDEGRDPETGKRRQRWTTVKGTKKQAEAKLAEVLNQINTGGYVKPTKLTMRDFLRQWERDYVAVSTKSRTQEFYHAIAQTITAKLGQIYLSDLTPSHIQRYYAELLEHGRVDGKGGLSGRTVHHHHRVIHEALNHAVRWGLVARNVALAVDPPRSERKEMKFLDSIGVHKLLDSAQGTMYYPIVHLAVYTGLRRGEILGLRWTDIDLESGTLSVVQVANWLRNGNGLTYQEPKSNRSKRPVSLSPAVVLSLKSYREKIEADMDLIGVSIQPDTLVFIQLDGRPFLPDTLSHAFAKIVNKAGLNGLRFHDLRHSHASLMLKAGVHVKVVSERLGHSSVAFTLDTYSHIIPGIQEDGALRFEKMLEISTT